MKALLDHIAEFPNELMADLETGSHHSNNMAAELFNKRHPSLVKWAEQLSKLVEQAEGEAILEGMGGKSAEAMEWEQAYKNMAMVVATQAAEIHQLKERLRNQAETIQKYQQNPESKHEERGGC
jgi:hypothetical protein